MAETRSITVKFEGLEALRDVVARLGEIRDQIADMSPRVGDEVARALNGAVSHGQRRLCEPEVGA